MERPPLDRIPAAADLCAGMLAFEPDARPTAEEALTHEWFTLDAEVCFAIYMQLAQPREGK